MPDILSLNAGSSSLKLKLFRKTSSSLEQIASASVKIAGKESVLTFDGSNQKVRVQRRYCVIYLIQLYSIDTSVWCRLGREGSLWQSH